MLIGHVIFSCAHHSTDYTDFNVTWNLNGSEYYTGEAANEYSTSIIGNYTVSFLHDVANGLGIDSRAFMPNKCKVFMTSTVVDNDNRCGRD